MTNAIQGFRTSPQGPAFDTADPEAPAGPPPDPTGASDHASALARYEDFVSQGPAPQCLNARATDFEYDRCPPKPVANPVLFARESGDAEAVSAADVQQGLVGDCNFFAPLGALASSPEGRALLQNAVVENKNAQGEVVSWTVTFHRAEWHPFGATTFRDVPVTVSEPFGALRARARSVTETAGGAQEVWPLVFEKAYAQYSGGYRRIAYGGQPAEAMKLLTGVDATSVSLNVPFRWVQGYSADQLQADLASGKMVVLSSRSAIGDKPNPDAHGLVGHHGYFVTGVEQRDGQLFVNLGNPWGEAEPQPVPFNELSEWFSRVTVGSLP
jgi:hypothetical protein